MKAIIAMVLVTLSVSVAWLVLNQRKLEQQIATLRLENQRIAEEAAQQPRVTPEALASAELALQSSQAALAATEQRLTNAMSRVAALEMRAVQNSPRMADARVFADLQARGLAPIQAPAMPRGPSSSHAPDGQLLQRSWGPEQVVGPPNTDRNGDIPTAWASRNPDGGEEWLNVNYDRPVDIAEVRIRETYNPGAISKVTALLPNGQEVTIWEGTQPPGEAPVDTGFQPLTRVQANSVKIYMDTRRVPGWNEIDAVQLIGSDGSSQWASSVTASSTYAEQ
jgi:hypothetical protein